jgi:hypothetical protein
VRFAAAIAREDTEDSGSPLLPSPAWPFLPAELRISVVKPHIVPASVDVQATDALRHDSERVNRQRPGVTAPRAGCLIDMTYQKQGSRRLGPDRSARLRTAIRYLLARGQLTMGTQARLAEHFGITRQRVHQIVVEERRSLANAS